MRLRPDTLSIWIDDSRSGVKEEHKKGARLTLIVLKQIADVNFPTRWADFRLFAFEGAHADRNPKVTETALALLLGDIHRTSPLVRIHSQCTTGDVFHSMRCDCHDQLHLALRVIAEQGAGVLVYEHQEGRGIGLMEKLRAYQLQDQGLDTIEANLRLGHAVDLRDYKLSVEILRFLKIRSLQLMTNNPEKIDAVRSLGIEIVRRVSADVPGNLHSAHYVATKRDKLGHLSNPTAGTFLAGNRPARGTSILEAGNAAGGSSISALNPARVSNS
ncbi:MAG: GTP cyclohydrolase II [Terracidiphilus sp.]|jgi:GTP cyclohydrolase II